MKTENTTTTTETHGLLSAHHDDSAARLKKLQDRLAAIRAETNTTPILGAAFREVDLGEVPLKPTTPRLSAWMEWVESRPIVCGLIAAAMGLTAGLIFGANI